MNNTFQYQWKDIFDGSNFSMLIAGSSGSGKTRLLIQILKEIRKNYDYFIVLCPSLEFSGDYKDFEKDDKKSEGRSEGRFQFFSEYNPSVLNEIMETQSEIIRKHGKNRCPKTVVILDDCLEFLRQHSLIENLFFKGRHINISPIVLVQKLRGVSTILRVNTRYAIFFRAGNTSETEAFLETYTGKRERSKIEDTLREWFKNLYSFLFADFKTQKYQDRYMLGVNGKLVKPIDWYDS